MKPIFRIFCGLISLVPLSDPTALAQLSPLWGNLEPGPYDVGFRTEFVYDYTRGYWPKMTATGHRDTLETARPMQISLWYPARPAPTAKNLVFGDYLRLDGESLGPDRTTPTHLTEAVVSLRGGPLSPFFPDGVPDSVFDNILSTRTAAFPDAAPADGPFPLVIHGGASLVGQSVLLEYLASHGYAVASVPFMSTSPAWRGRGEGTGQYYQVGADDVGFVLGWARQNPFIDTSRTAMIGMFSAFGLLFQMQHMQLDAIAVLDGSYPLELTEIPGFDLRAVRIPILDMPRSHPSSNRALLDSLRYSERFRVALNGVSHLDFYQFQRLAHPDRSADHTAYHAIASITHAFLDHVFLGDVVREPFWARSGLSFGVTDSLFSIERVSPDPALPTEAEFLLLIRRNQIEEARRLWQQSRCDGTTCHLAGEQPFITTLLFLRRDVGARASLEAFRLLADMVPESRRARELLTQTEQMAQ